MAAGAVCANHVEAERLIVRAGRVEGMRACDRLTGDRFEIRARLVLNAAGPYADAFLRAGLGQGLSPPTPFSRDAYFIVDRPLLAGDEALAVPSMTSDPDAILSRGARHLFIVPWRGVTLIGVWHKLYPGHPDGYSIDEAELAAWIVEINSAYRGLDLTIDDVALGSAGLVPFGDNRSRRPAPEICPSLAGRSITAATAGRTGSITLVGVRYTTAPVEAPDVVSRVAARLGQRSPALAAGQRARPRRGVRELRRAARGPRRPGAAGHRSGQPGSARLQPWRGRRRGAAARGQAPGMVAHAGRYHRARGGGRSMRVRNEMALTLADVLFRRTDLCTAGPPGDAVIAEAARLAAAAAGWSTMRREAELDLVRRRLRLVRTGRAFLDATELAEPALVA